MQSTNLFISNVHPTTDEQQLKQAFMQFGEIDSIKIMWPRTPEEHERGRNNAFVCFSLRAHASLALEAMDGQVLDGNKLCVRWGKPVSKLVAGAAKAAKESAGEEPENPFNAVQDEVTVHRPKDPAVLRTIHWTIQHVLQYGTPFEVMLINRGDPRLAFLINSRSAEGVYYRWRMYSLLNGDTKERWRTKMFVMYDQGGPVWQPPPIVRDVLGLSRVEREQLVDALNHVTNERGSVAHAMKLAIECASAWEDVVDVVTRSLLDDAAPYMSKYARLLVVSDILHNCSEQGAWRLRQGFEKVLDRVFRHLADVYRAIEARLRAEHFRKLVLAVLAVWEVRMVFPPDMLHAFSKGFL
ncbi:RNA-binding domain-containing protein [Linderina pennispora]|uniref:RNA-binding domain-containing protein n=1 Tax=Linderina pennispora TaxID=61395 RepID=A0A1Y1WAL9_9FUNG|nr:RNA-binding domain-containing protein [Linderina pennispora]ORX70194.1 RNA-binding domain-containing protein [Linderina pennispora]